MDGSRSLCATHVAVGCLVGSHERWLVVELRPDLKDRLVDLGQRELQRARNLSEKQAAESTRSGGLLCGRYHAIAVVIHPLEGGVALGLARHG